MKLNEAFPSNYLKADDLQGVDTTMTIKEYKMEKIGDETKLVLFFRGVQKSMVCNKTNADRIAHYYGQDLDDWINKSIVLGTELVTFQGKTTEAIRVKGRPSPQQTAQATTAVPAAKAEAPFDDSVPF